MKPRFLPIFLTLCPLVLGQSAASAYDDLAQQQILQIQQQLQSQFPQHQNSAGQPQQPAAMPMSQGMSQAPDAQQQILQINQQLQQMSQGQQQPARMMPQQMSPQMQPMPQMQQNPGMQRPQMLQQSPMMQQAQMMPQSPSMQSTPAMQAPSQQMSQAQSVSQNTGFAPSNTQSLNLPVLNSTVSGYTAVNDVIPNAVGATSGVDILDESLKFHSQVNGQPASRPANPMPKQQMQAGASLSQPISLATVFGGNGQSSNASANGGQISTRAIGAIGAAALVGTFLGNGGVGGMMKSTGWDNSRHTRGMSIGGY
ncbi:MAG: hypothetical protein SGJ27_18930 [Candidatus Melainabacteria bacterium]|nr:hypothetical protein [Candidatus Melainabacteria bacterium]